MDNKSVGTTQHLGERSTGQQPDSCSARVMAIILSERGLLGGTWVFHGEVIQRGPYCLDTRNCGVKAVTGRNGG